MGARGRRGAAALALMTLVSLVWLATGQDGEGDGTPAGPACSLATLELCEDKCTLDGQRESPCELECDPESGLCYDKCAAYSVDLALEEDVFDATCANRLASREAREFVADADQSPLREPPQVTAGLSSVPFSMFRNGLLHTGRSDHPGPSVARVAWTYKTGGRVFSSPTLASDGTVYVGCTDGFVYGVQSSGVIKWKYPAGGPVVSTAAIGNPIGSDTTLFMGGSDGTLHAVSANYGTSKWSYIRPQLHLNGKWQMRAKRPIVSSAALAPEGIVYIGADTALYALNAATGSGGFSGTVKWAYETRGLIMGSPALDRDGRIFVGSMDGSLYALRQSDGGFIWQFDAEGGLYSSPALDGEGRLYVGSVDSYLYALDSATGRLAWKFRASAAIYSSPAVSPGGPEGGGLVFVGCTDWKLYAVRQRDGLLAWNQTLRRAPPEEAPPPPVPPAPPSPPPATPGPPPPSDGSAAASPPPPGDATPSEGAKAPYVLADERARREAETILEAEGVCPPNLAQGTSEEAAFRFGWNPVLPCGGDTGAVGVVASPVYSPNGLVYVGSSDSYFYAVENLTGAVRWAMFADGPVQSSAAVDEDGKLFFATDAGTIYQIADPPEGG